MNTRIRAECGREFQPSSRHRHCPACRSHNLCACGARKQYQAATCAACHTESGAANNNWRGGKTRHRHGYPMIWAPDHPRTGNGSYVFEHVLVMEEMLGRYLLPGENVHHRNGVRDDNRPENPGEPRAMDKPAAGRHPRLRRSRVGTRDRRPIRP